MKLSKIPFSKPTILGNEINFVQDCIFKGKLAGDGEFTKKCQSFFETRYNFLKSFLTTSCTDALELAALLLDLKPGDEIIMPSFTFVSTANPFVLRGAHIRFCDSNADNPNIDTKLIEELITPKTKAIVVVHYAGIAVDMDPILEICDRHKLMLIEDAAQSIDAKYKDRFLGGIGDLGTFSFHETKNITCGEGGLLSINNARHLKKAEILREKGTNRSAFFRGEIDKYGWVDVGSSFLPSDILAAFLYAQIEKLDEIQNSRKRIWQIYSERFANSKVKDHFNFQKIPSYATNNGHMFYIVCTSLDERISLTSFLKQNEIYPAFHYQSLHASPYFEKHHDGRSLSFSDKFSNCLLRLPLFYGMSEAEVNYVCDKVEAFYLK